MTSVDSQLSLDDILSSFRHHSARDWDYHFSTNSETCDASGVTESDYVSHSYIAKVSEDKKVWIVRNLGRRNYRSKPSELVDNSRDKYFDEFLVTLTTKNNLVLAQFEGEELKEVYERVRLSVQRHLEETEKSVREKNGLRRTV